MITEPVPGTGKDRDDIRSEYECRAKRQRAVTHRRDFDGAGPENALLQALGETGDQNEAHGKGDWHCVPPF